MREALPEELISAIRTVSQERKYFNPAVVQLINGKGKYSRKPDLADLTARGLDVLEALVKGQNNLASAEELFSSEHTMKKHVGPIPIKFDLKDGTQAALFTLSKGQHETRP